MFVNEPEPIKKIFVETLGGRVTATGSLEFISFPGIMVSAARGLLNFYSRAA